MALILRTLVLRVLTLILTLFVVTAVLYATVMFTPPETRAELFMPRNFSPRMTEEMMQKMIEDIIERYHLDAPYPVQYYYWITNLFKGNWGYSPSMQEDIFSAIMRRTPVTAELTLYSLLVFIPLGLISGVIAGSKRNRLADHTFRFTAFVATSLPPFILALILLSIFYVDLHWFPPMRTSSSITSILMSDEYRQFTGLLTIDGLLNHRPDISLDALRHLVLPVFTLSIVHWATLGRVTRAIMIEELNQNYVVAAQARGIPDRRITWRHTLRNAISPSLTSSLLSAATLLTGIFVVEILYSFPGISNIAVSSMAFVPDTAAAIGFAVYNVIMVWILMSLLDFLQMVINPLRGGKS